MGGIGCTHFCDLHTHARPIILFLLLNTLFTQTTSRVASYTRVKGSQRSLYASRSKYVKFSIVRSGSVAWLREVGLYQHLSF
jgi:hypothetical protein